MKIKNSNFQSLFYTQFQNYEKPLSYGGNLEQGIFGSKPNVTHHNPVKAGVVEKEEEYLYSSCGRF